MIARRQRLWWGFGLGAGVVLAALAWASVAVTRLEARNAEIRAESQRQELIRLALWRLDSQLASIIAMEAARPAGSGIPIVAGRLQPERDEHIVQTASPQIFHNAYAKGFFEITPSGEVAATDDRTRDLAQQLQQSPPFEELADTPAPGSEPDPQPESQAQSYDFAARKQIASIATRETDASRQSVPAPQSGATRSDRAAESALMLEDGAIGLPGTAAPAAVEPRWLDSDSGPPELVLVRTLTTPDGPRAEGVSLDWALLERSLTESISDLLPATTLLPARGADALRLEREGRAYRLATIPALLLPDKAVAMPKERMTPALWALLVTWLATLTALIAVAAVLRATLRLSDRRARFVGAVTHELRTPLTTFRLYAQMLAGGMVTDEKAKAEYLNTLDRESVRLGEIVENVLEYARLTRRRPGDARPPGERSITASELLARVRPVLSRRAEQSGMDLIVSVDPSVDAGDPPRTVTCDPRSVERILMNLIENACKYALPQPVPGAPEPEDADTRIHLDITRTDRHLELLIADHGPGVPRRERERVFGEFHRGPGAAESSRPGLGLGLALSRGLAREMGGDLRMTRRRDHGAEFLLTIPLDPSPA
ncbi:MAG: sensor histidine kinase [Planctomycetota bacterium]|nr:MAG: sensor histidine kinase [Planctomycetota bacterium]